MKNRPGSNNAELKKKSKGFYVNDSQDYNVDNRAGLNDRKKHSQKKQGFGEHRTLKDENHEPVSKFISEGNPNTEKVIQEARESAAQSQEEIRGLPGETRNDQSNEDEEGTGSSDDASLVAEIEEAIKTESSIPEQDKHISLTVDNGVVILKGVASSEEVRKSIEDKVASFVGYSRVGNYLRIDVDGNY